MLRALPRAAAGIAASLALQQTCQQSEDRLGRWRKRWEGDTRGWELGKTVHPRLAEFEERLLPEPSRVLVPLAGQSHDVAHLAWRGHNVVAVEGVPAALDAFKATYGADEARRIAGHACDDYDGDDVRGALATMHVVRLPFEGGSKRLTWHTGDFLGNFSCPIVWKSTGTATPSTRRVDGVEVDAKNSAAAPYILISTGSARHAAFDRAAGGRRSRDRGPTPCQRLVRPGAGCSS